MNNLIKHLYAAAAGWLIVPDDSQAGVCNFVRGDIADPPEDNFKFLKAKFSAMESGPGYQILSTQKPDDYWKKPGPDYSLKHASTAWQLNFLSQFSADGLDKRIQAACKPFYLHNIAVRGAFPMTDAPASLIRYLSGNPISDSIDHREIRDDRSQML